MKEEKTHILLCCLVADFTALNKRHTLRRLFGDLSNFNVVIFRIHAANHREKAGQGAAGAAAKTSGIPCP